MCAPSTSASVIITMRSYRSFVRSLTSPIPIPSAIMSDLISLFASILSRRACSTFRIFPRSGRIAWNSRLRPCLAEPPAESPSTMKISHWLGSRLLQSASLPGSVMPSSAPLRMTLSLAARAARRARAAKHFATMSFPSDGCSSKYCESFSLTTVSTAVFISALPSLLLVWPSNWGSLRRTEITAVSPSRTSSAVRFSSFSLRMLWLRA